LKGAPYNPRRISDANKAKLKKSLGKNGLVGTITWNKRTGHVVGGHQRLAAIDSLEGSKDYLLDVAVIDVDEAEEKAINIALNNQSAMGDWDFEELGKLLEGNVDLEAMAFSDADVYAMFGDTKVETRSAEKLLELGEKIRQAKETYSKIAQKNRGKNDHEFYDVIVWPDKTSRIAFWNEMGHQDPQARYKNGEEITNLIIGE